MASYRRREARPAPPGSRPTRAPTGRRPWCGDQSPLRTQVAWCAL